MDRLGRRALIAGVVGAVATAGTAAARLSSGTSERVLRVGVMTNLTHAPLIAGLGSGRVARALAPHPVEIRVFRAGPRVTEALLGGAIDVGTSGPAAVVIHHARHARNGAGGLRILTGCCSGGASLVVHKASGIARAEDLRGKRVGVTQLATTQDVALRVFIRNAGLRDTASGGDVDILAISGATILDQMRRGELHAAWLPEPWATRVVSELPASRLVDERDLWPGRRFATAVLTTRAERAGRDPRLGLLAQALDAEVARASADPGTTLAEAHEELKKHVGNPGSLALFERAAHFVDFTSDPLRASVERFADDAASFGFCPPHQVAGLFG